jgi:epoxyqueuosine reductase
MSKFHSVLSRREFMKKIGMAGAGLGAASLTAPVFHDLDEVISASDEGKSLDPWWVKEQDYEKPTVEFSFDKLVRPDMAALTTYTTYRDVYGQDLKNHPIVKAWGYDQYLKYKDQQSAAAKEGLLQKLTGNDLKQKAIAEGAAFGHTKDFPEFFLGDPDPLTPEKLGVPKWQGTPEENLKLVRVANRFYGAAKTNATTLWNEQYRNFFWIKGRDYEGPVNYNTYSVASPTRNIEFEDVEKPYTTATKKVIPKSFKDIVVWMIPQSDYITRIGPATTPERGRIQPATTMAYSNLHITERRFQRFMRCLGYWALGGGTGALAPITAWAVFAGLGEMSRMNPLLTTEWGTMIRSTVIDMTDMPLAPTKPIDAGMWKFCHVCGLCAQACSFGALNLDKEPSWETKGWFNYPGKKIFFIDYSKCQIHREATSGCDNCMCSCPFSKQEYASVHDVIQQTVATTSLFNSFFVTMDQAFGYGNTIDEEEFWNRLDLPVNGIDSTRGGLKRFH